MALKLVLAFSTLALSGCASGSYGYAYCYDPYGGPVGYYTGPFEPKPACATQTAQSAGYAAHEAGYRGPYVSGPYTPASPAEAR